MGRPVILVIVDWFLPAFKAGGPVRSIVNLVDRLADEFEFHILTRDRDLGADAPFQGLPTRSWLVREGYRVNYVPHPGSPWEIHRAIREVPYDLIFLNSYFSAFAFSTLLLRRLGLLRPCRVVLAPRGELADGALRLKGTKKRIYIRLARLFGLYSDLTWYASSESEKAEIGRISAEPTRIAPNLPPRVDMPDAPWDGRPPKRPGEARLVFLSRLARKKNLDGALRILRKVRGNVVFDVFGTSEDPAYLEQCRGLMATLPAHVRCRYRGPVPHERVLSTLSAYHFFFLPTLNENFGHVILEALTAALPVVISDQTYWRDLSEKGVGFDIPLADEAQFVARIEALIGLDQQAYARLCRAAHDFARSYVESPRAAESSRDLFRAVLA